MWSDLDKLTLVSIDEISPQIARCNLGDGESEVLTLALIDSSYRAVIDDRAARACAKALAIPVLGTGGLLILAKRRQLIESVRTALDNLVESGLWLSPEVRQMLLDRAGEAK